MKLPLLPPGSPAASWTIARILPAAALLALGLPSAAQTTHEVFVSGIGFSGQYTPKNLTINVGDTVKWTWVSGIHDVVSGVGGAPDGIFASTLESPPFEYQLTFDSAFLAANPVAGNRYDYFCTLHITVGMVGSVTVDEPAVVTPFGCLNPTGSLVDVAGAPRTGTVWTVGVDNPLGTQPVGSLAFLGVSATPALGVGCGIPVPGWGMSAPGASGEILIGVTGGNPFLTLGPQPWPGPGLPATFPIDFPPNPNLVGATLYFQGMVYDQLGISGITLGLTEAFAATIGNG